MPTFGKKTLLRENKSLGLDKVPLPELSLNSFLTMRNPEDNIHKLKTLKKRYCRFSHSKITSILRQRTEHRAMNQMVFYDKYNDLLVFECKHLRLIIQVLFAILDYNRTINHSEDQQFLCFFEPLLDKVAAITKFQQAVRLSMFRKKLKE